MDISICIPARGSEIGLWSTMESCQYALDGAGLKHEFLLAVNEPQISQDFRRIGAGDPSIAHFGHVPDYRAPAQMRQLLMAKAKGKYIFLLDSHCQVNRDYFRHAVDAFEKHAADVMHSAYRYWRSETVGLGGMHYEYQLNVHGQFWSLPTYRTPRDENDAYECASSGFGGVAMRRSTWQEVGGFCPALNALGGTSEYCTDLTMWRLGKKVMLHPRMVHSHWAGARGYERHYNVPWFESWTVTGLVLGGDSLRREWCGELSRCPNAPRSMELGSEREAAALKYADWLNVKSVRTLDEALRHFDACGIRH